MPLELRDKLIGDFGETFVQEERNSSAFVQIVLCEDLERLE